MLSEMAAAGVIPTVDTFNTLMDACSYRHDYEAVVRLFGHMVQSGENHMSYLFLTCCVDCYSPCALCAKFLDPVQVLCCCGAHAI